MSTGYQRGNAKCIRVKGGKACGARLDAHVRGQCPRMAGGTYLAGGSGNRYSLSLNERHVELLSEIISTIEDNKKLTRYDGNDDLTELAEIVHRVAVRVVKRKESAASGGASLSPAEVAPYAPRSADANHAAEG
jgi:hypothetical protein